MPINQLRIQKELEKFSNSLTGNDLLLWYMMVNYNNKEMKISEKGIALLKQFESLRLEAYLDSAGIPTIGYGCIFYQNWVKVKMGDKITKEDAEKLFIFHINNIATGVNNLLKTLNINLSQSQFDAVCSLCYNIGIGAFKKSSIWKIICLSPNSPKIADSWRKYKFSGGKIVKGLIARREKEINLYFLDSANK